MAFLLLPGALAELSSGEKGLPTGSSRKAIQSEDPLNKALELADYISGDRTIALQILMEALKKLEVTCTREGKRNYWRDKALKGSITKVTFERLDTLQRLIYSEAEPYERQTEQLNAGSLTEPVMIFRFVKHLVRISTNFSMFYVNIGVTRILHNYTTAEAQRIYELLTDRYPEADQYRRTKSILMKSVKDRFGSLLAVCLAEHGEERFVSKLGSQDYLDYFTTCLDTLTPWAETCLLADGYNANADELPSGLSGRGLAQSQQDWLEANRIHAIIHPSCYSRLTKGLGLRSPQEMLSVPQFDLPDSNVPNPGSSGKHDPPTVALTDDERRLIRDHLEAAASRRKRVSPQLLRVLVDGVERACLKGGGLSRAICEISEGTERLELWARESQREVLLATYLFGPTDWKGEAGSKSSIALEGRQKVEFIIRPSANSEGTLGQAAVEVTYYPRSSVWLWDHLRSLLQTQFNVPAYTAVAAGLAGLLLVGWSYAQRRQINLLQQRSAETAERLNRERSAQSSSGAALPATLPNPTAFPGPYTLTRLGSLRGSGTSNQAPTTVVVTSSSAVVTFDLPVVRNAYKTYRVALEPEERELEILTEDFLRVRERATGVSVLAYVPAALLEDKHSYLVRLQGRTEAGKLESVDDFSFEVTKK